MIYFDRKFLELATALNVNIVLFLRYVDDTNCVVEGVQRSLVLDLEEKKFIDKDPSSDRDEVKTEGEMMDLMRTMADSIVKMVKWEADYNPSTLMPGSRCWT